MKQATSFSRGVISAAVAIFVFSFFIMSCKKQNASPSEISKEETISQIAASKQFATLITQIEIQFSIIQKNQKIVDNIQAIIEGDKESLTGEESYIYDSYMIQGRMVNQILASWPTAKLLTRDDVKTIHELYEQNKIVNTIQTKPNFMDEGPDCAKIRNQEVDQCFRYFVYDLGECWFSPIPNPGCYYSAVKDQYRCNKAAETNYKNCQNQ